MPIAPRKPDAKVTEERVRGRASVSELATFVYTGRDKRGVKMKGDIQAKNAAIARAELRKIGMTVDSIKPRGKDIFGRTPGSKIKARDIAVFSRQIAVMMQAGVPMVQGLEIMGSGSKNPRMRNLVSGIKQDVEGGESLHGALAKHPVQFDELYCNLVKAGETAGVLDTVLDTVATYKENTEALKGKIKKAMFYPIAVIAVAIIVSAILLIFVVPQFEEVFKNFGAQLPAFTQAIVNLSRALTHNGLTVLLAVGAVVGVVGAVYNRSQGFQNLVARATLKIPVVGQILVNSAIARFARTLGVTFAAGVPLVEALDSVSKATGSPIYNKAVVRIRDDVSIGHQLQLAMKQTNLFPTLVVQMVAIGEEAGALDKMLFKVADFYEQEVNNAVDALSSLLEPFIMVVIGTLVGSMVIGMYLPIFKLAAVVG